MSQSTMEPNFKRLVDSLQDGVYFVNKNRVIQYWNAAAEKITGFSAQEVLGRRCSENILNHVDSEGKRMCENNCPLADAIANGTHQEADIFLHHKDGHRVPVSVQLNPVFDSGGNIVGGVELFSDISGQEVTQLRIDELEKLALLDPLTGLANRRFIEMELENRLREQERYGWIFGLLLMDLDGFKQINDDFGHLAGDSVLKAVALTIAKNARPFDLFGRWGGDEFIGLLKNVDAKMVYDIGRRLRLLIKESYILAEDKEIAVTVSIGGTIARSDDNRERLINRADKLMYKSKKGGRNRFTMDLSNQS